MFHKKKSKTKRFDNLYIIYEIINSRAERTDNINIYSDSSMVSTGFLFYSFHTQKKKRKEMDRLCRIFEPSYNDFPLCFSGC